MPEPNLFQIFTSRMNKLGLPYMVTGAVASIIYGAPRLTHDIDLVLELDPESAEKIVEAFPSEEFYCPPIENIRQEALRSLRGHFNIIHHETGFKADIYIAGQDELHRWALLNRRKLEIEGEVIWVAPPEYVILRKLEYYREGRSEKHLQDIANMLEISSDKMDFKELQNKIRAYGLRKEWKKAQEMAKY
jgi:hypothetical protein